MNIILPDLTSVLRYCQDVFRFIALRIRNTTRARMIRSFLVTVSLSLCWTLSPDVLVLLGNGIGKSGTLFFAILFVGAAFSAIAANVLHHPSLPSGGSNDRDILSALIGPFWAITLTLAGRLSPVLLLSTGMLVTAGFTFNETFVFWFPNFGFSFLLLALVVALQLGGDKVVITTQSVFFSVTVTCLLFLSLAGLISGPPVPQPAAIPAESFPELFSLIALSLLLFLGYDQQPPSESGEERLNYFLAIGIGFLLLALWGFVSLQHVPQARLAESTVPYATSAKAILGQPGRVIMGIAIISGACGAVNGLFYLSGRALRRVFPGISLQNTPHRSWLQQAQVIFIALVIALFMAGGLAGTKNLETFIFGALLFWLLTIGANCLAAARILQKHRENHSSQGYAIGAVLLAAVAYLAFTYSQLKLLGSFLLLVLIASASLSAAWCWYNRKKRNRVIINN